MKRRKDSTFPVTTAEGSADVLQRLKVLNRKQRHAVLATESHGVPHASLVAFALTSDLREVLFATPRATRKYRNILKNRNVSILIDTRTNTDRGYLGAESVTILGEACPVRRGKGWHERAGVFMKKHPRLATFIHAQTTSLIAVKIIYCSHVNKFQSITEYRMNNGTGGRPVRPLKGKSQTGVIFGEMKKRLRKRPTV